MELSRVKESIEKIRSGPIETKERQISNLHSKLSNKILTGEWLSSRFLELPSIIIQWINDFQDSASPEIIHKAVQIILFISESSSGAKLLVKYGAIEFFFGFRGYASSQASLEIIINDLDELLRNIVKATQQQQDNNNNSQNEQQPQGQQLEQQKEQIKENSNFDDNNEEKLQEQDEQQSRFDYVRTITAQTITQTLRPVVPDQTINKMSKNINHNTFMDATPNANNNNSNASMKQLNTTTNKNTAIMERLSQNQIDTTSVDWIPQYQQSPLELSDSDEKVLFDIGVQLKFADNAVQYELLSEYLPAIIEDYPPQVFTRKYEIIEELIRITTTTTTQNGITNTATASSQNEEIRRYYAFQCQSLIIASIAKAVKVSQSPLMADARSANATQLHLRDDRAYIQLSYPSLKQLKGNKGTNSNNSTSIVSRDPSSYGTWTLFQITQAIGLAAIESIQNELSIGHACRLLAELTNALNHYKKVNLAATQMLVGNLLNRAANLIHSKEDVIYSELQYLCVLLRLRDIFCILDASEYESLQANQKKTIEQVYFYLFNPQLRCVFSKEQFDQLYAYAVVFPNSSGTISDQKLTRLAASVQELKNFELQVPGYSEGLIFTSIGQFQKFNESLQQILLALPFASHSKYPRIYLECLLFTIAEKPRKPLNGQLFYNDIRRSIVQIAHIPTKTTANTLFLEILSGLLRNDWSIRTVSGQSFSSGQLICQSLLDPYLSSQLILAGLSQEQNIPLILQIIHNFCSIYFTQSGDINAIDHIYRFLPVFSQLQLAENEQISSIAQLLTEQLKNHSEEAWISVLTIDLFSKHAQIRKRAFQILKNEQLLNNTFINRETTHYVARIQMQHKADELNVLNDPLEQFMSGQADGISYIDRTISPSKNSSSTMKVSVSSEEILSLCEVSNNPKVQSKLKSAAIEQLVEKLHMLDRKHTVSKEIEQAVVAVIQGTVVILSQVDNAQNQNPMVIDAQLKASYLVLLTAFLGNLTLLPKLRYQVLLCLTADIQAQLKYNLLCNLLSPAKDLQFYSLKLLYLLSLSLSPVYSRNAATTNTFEIKSPSSHHLLKGQLIEFQTNMVYQSAEEIQTDTWKSIYPLNSYEEHYIKELQNVSNAEELFGKELKTLQSKVVIAQAEELDITSTMKSMGQLLQWFSLHQALVDTSNNEDSDMYTFDRVPHNPINPLFYSSTVSQLLMKFLAVNSNIITNEGTNNSPSTYSILALDIYSEILHSTTKPFYNSCVQLSNLITEISEYLQISQLSYLFQIPLVNLQDTTRMKHIVQFLNTLLSVFDLETRVHLPHHASLTKKLLLNENSLFIQLLVKCHGAAPHNHQLSDTYVRTLTFMLGLRTTLTASTKLQIFLQQQFHSLIMHFLSAYTGSSIDFFNTSKIINIMKLFHRFLLVFSPQVLLDDAVERTKLVASKKHLLKASSIGWILSFTQNRQVAIRTMAWNIVLLILEPRVLKFYGSIIDSCLAVILSPNEAYSVVIIAMRVLSKALQIYEENMDIYAENQEDKGDSHDGIDGSSSDLNAQEVLVMLKSKNILSHIKANLEKQSAPDIFYANLICLLHRLARLDGANTVAVASQLELFDAVVGLLNVKFNRSTNNKQKNNKTSQLVSSTDGNSLKQTENNKENLKDNHNHSISSSDTKNNSYKGQRNNSLSDKTVQVNDPAHPSPAASTTIITAVTSSRLMTISLACNFLTFVLTLDRNQQNYLVNGTDILKNSLKWLKIISEVYSLEEYANNTKNKAALDDCVSSLVKLLHTCIIFNEDVTVFAINKHMQDKLEKSNCCHSYVNIFRSVSCIIALSNNEEMKRSSFQFLGQLVGGWRTTSEQLIDSEDVSNETTTNTTAMIGENLVLQTYRQYKLLNHLFLKQELDIAPFKVERNNLLCWLAGLLATSNYAKQAVICSGFYQEILSELVSVLDYINIDNAPQIFNTTTTKANSSTIKRKIIKDQPVVQKYSERPIESEDCIYYINLFKALFCCKLSEHSTAKKQSMNEEAQPFTFEKSITQLMKLSNTLLDILHKLLTLSLNNSDALMESFSRMIINFSSHPALSKILCQRLVDGKSAQLLTEIQATIGRMEGISKDCFRHCLQMLEVLGQHEELRKVFYRQKFIDSVNAKFFEIYNRKREWTPHNFYGQIFTHFLLALSFYPDAHLKIIGTKNTFEMLIHILEESNCTTKLSEMILLLFCNVAFSADCKVFFTAKEHRASAIMMTVLTADHRLSTKDIVCQLFENLLYKSSSAIIMFNRSEVIQELTFLHSEMLRQIDKFSLAQNSENAVSSDPQRDEEKEEDQLEYQENGLVHKGKSGITEMGRRKRIVQNLGHVLYVLATVW